MKTFSFVKREKNEIGRNGPLRKWACTIVVSAPEGATFPGERYTGVTGEKPGP